MLCRIENGDSVLIQTDIIINAAGAAVTGLAGGTAVQVRIRRQSDGFFFDFSTNTFRVIGDVVTLNQDLAEIDATNLAGIYEFDWTTNPAAADDEYTFYLTGGSAAVVNLPASILLTSWSISGVAALRRTLSDLIAYISGVVGAKTSGGPVTQIFRDPDDLVDVLTTVTDAQGNRTTSTPNFP